MTDYEDVKRIFREEFGKEIDDYFLEFSKEPIASASLAQVHKARLRSTGEINEGEVVAVKVQHPWIKEAVPGDIRLMKLSCDIT